MAIALSQSYEGDLDVPGRQACCGIRPVGVLAGAAGLLLGLAGARWIGIVAAAGLTLYFIGAVAALVRSRVLQQLVYPAPFLLLASASLLLALAAD